MGPGGGQSPGRGLREEGTRDLGSDFESDFGPILGCSEEASVGAPAAWLGPDLTATLPLPTGRRGRPRTQGTNQGLLLPSSPPRVGAPAWWACPRQERSPAVSQSLLPALTGTPALPIHLPPPVCPSKGGSRAAWAQGGPELGSQHPQAAQQEAPGPRPRPPWAQVLSGEAWGRGCSLAVPLGSRPCLETLTQLLLGLLSGRGSGDETLGRGKGLPSLVPKHRWS